mmetsp:Transcript_36643/g.103354  ORF Transcript_36643/g.103354 Transcript_36643/m.103354 type:complete len:582 (-) Transcript_36643:84-1829(-)
MGRDVGILVLASVATLVAGEGGEYGASEAANQGISIMLLGSVGFMMGIFYLVNFKDEDIIKYTWQVISSTISIFSAVLLFQAVNGVVEEFVIGEGASDEFKLVVAVVHMLLWFALLQLVLAWISGAIGSTVIEEDTEEFETMELNLKCWAVLFGHITGFAAINAFAIFQQMVPRNLLATFLVAPLAWLSIYVLGLGTDRVREHVALADDGVKDKCEEAWDKETEETEDDIIGLAVSFIFAQTLRYFVSGELPDAEGNEPDKRLSGHSNLEVLLLVGMSVIFTAANVARTILIKGRAPGRLTPQMRNIVMMDFAWCFFFSADWWISSNFFATEHGMIKEVILALFVTAVAFIMIFFLDTLADKFKKSASDVDQALRAIVQAYGILIGFSWEKAFDVAVEECTEFLDFMNAAVAKLMLALILAAVVIPAWRLHILPNIMDMEAEEEMEEKEKEEEEKEHEERKSRGNLVEPLLGPEEMAKELEKKALKSIKKFKASLSSMSSSDLKKKTIDLKTENDTLHEKIRVHEDPTHPEHRAHYGAHHPPQHTHQIQHLEKRNAELEASLSEISGQLNELQSLADLLST